MNGSAPLEGGLGGSASRALLGGFLFLGLSPPVFRECQAPGEMAWSGDQAPQGLRSIEEVWGRSPDRPFPGIPAVPEERAAERPQGVRRIRKAAKRPTAAQGGGLLPAASASRDTAEILSRRIFYIAQKFSTQTFPQWWNLPEQPGKSIAGVRLCIKYTIAPKFGKFVLAILTRFCYTVTTDDSLLH